MSDLTLYKDEELKHPFMIENLGEVEAGEGKKVTGYLYNSTVDIIKNITYETLDQDVHISNVPELLEGESWARVEIDYSPDRLRTTPLNTFVTFRGKRVIPPE